MAKKKRSGSKKKTSSRKPVAARKPVAKKKAAKKKTTKKNPVSKKKTPAKKKAVPRKKAKTASLGRPRVTGEELLDTVFKPDFDARQVFAFLGVAKFKELEKLSPEQIIDRLSAPLLRTVQGIRRRLADNNRHLAGDKAYALEHKAFVTRDGRK